MRCLRCGENHFSEVCRNAIKCANCKGPHLASDKLCIAYCYNLEVMELKGKIEANIKDAALLIDERFAKEFNIRVEETQVIASIEDQNKYLNSLTGLEDADLLDNIENPQILPIGEGETQSGVGEFTDNNSSINSEERRRFRVQAV